MLRIEKLTAGYGEAIVLREASLNVEAGEFVALVGSNGCGKTTMLRAISGLLKPAAGSIFLEDLDLTGAPPHTIVTNGIIHVPEGRQVISNMTILENLLIGGQNIRARELRKTTLDQVFQMFPTLEARKKQMAGTLSGGEQQMLAIGRGLMAIPRVLLLDEPSLGLSPVLVEEVFKTIQKLNEKGLSILLVEQNITLSLSVSDRGYVLENGRISMSGESSSLLKNDDIKRAYLGL